MLAVEGQVIAAVVSAIREGEVQVQILVGFSNPVRKTGGGSRSHDVERPVGESADHVHVDHCSNRREWHGRMIYKVAGSKQTQFLACKRHEDHRALERKLVLRDQ